MNTRDHAHHPGGAYSGYHLRGVPSEDTEITHVGSGTPCGEYLRRFWQPIARSTDLDESPLAVRVMGEDLVLFRDGSDRLGLLHRHCSHRGTSLEFGRVAERGIRCCYHGWLFDIDGRILETPGESTDSKLKDRIWHGAYRVREFHGLIFAYMGPPDMEPDFPILDTFELPGYRSAYEIFHLPCNWLQIKENCMDPVHTAFLHTIVSGMQFSNQFGILPQLDWLQTPAGMIYIATRRIGDHVWIRINDFIYPNIHQFPPHWEDGGQERIFGRPMATVWTVPVDDTNTMSVYWYRIHQSLNMSDEELERQKFGQGGERPYSERKLLPGDYDAQVSQRPIAVHDLEHLGGTDRGVVMLRRILRENIQRARSGVEPVHTKAKGGGVIPTLSQDTVLRIPAAATAEADSAMLHEIGRKVAAGDYLGREKSHAVA